jgi:Domain found in Dishevelled, Egl-10, and Pleckstrin (DEP)
VAAVCMCRVYRLRTYRNCFIGQEAVEWLVSQGHATTPAEATRLGQQLVQAGLVHHVTDDHTLENKYLFYRFRLPARSLADSRLHVFNDAQESNSSSTLATDPKRGGLAVESPRFVPQDKGAVLPARGLFQERGHGPTASDRGADSAVGEGNHEQHFQESVPQTRSAGHLAGTAVPQRSGPMAVDRGSRCSYPDSSLRVSDGREGCQKRQRQDVQQRVAPLEEKARALDEVHRALHALSESLLAQDRKISKLRGNPACSD